MGVLYFTFQPSQSGVLEMKRKKEVEERGSSRRERALSTAISFFGFIFSNLFLLRKKLIKKRNVKKAIKRYTRFVVVVVVVIVVVVGC